MDIRNLTFESERKKLSESLFEHNDAPAGAELMEILSAGINDFIKPDRWDNFNKLTKRMENACQLLKQTKSTSLREDRELQNKIVMLNSKLSRQNEKLEDIQSHVEKVDTENTRINEQISADQEIVDDIRKKSFVNQSSIMTSERKYFGTLQNICTKEIRRNEILKASKTSNVVCYEKEGVFQMAPLNDCKPIITSEVDSTESLDVVQRLQDFREKMNEPPIEEDETENFENNTFVRSNIQCERTLGESIDMGGDHADEQSSVEAMDYSDCC
ncbi:unnamed protein product [Auanema sp. JU1783]|nr:unnamed protein product [Auanema sp. JU1783]